MRTRMKISRSLFRGSALGALLLALAVSASAQETPKKASDKSDGSAIKLMVENNNYLDMHLYGMRNGYYSSIGVVTGLSKAELIIPETLTTPGGEFQILADPIGGTVSYLTDPIILGTSREVDLTIQNALELSSFTIR
jgi:hypothetical protein